MDRNGRGVPPAPLSTGPPSPAMLHFAFNPAAGTAAAMTQPFSDRDCPMPGRCSPFARLFATFGRRRPAEPPASLRTEPRYVQPRRAPVELADALHSRPFPASKPIATDDETRLVRLLSPLYGADADAVSARLLLTFGSLPAIFRTGRSALERELPDEPRLVELLLAIHPLVGAMLRAEMLAGPALPDNQAALDYLYVVLAHEPAEQVRMLYLDAKNRILVQEVASQGSVTKADIFPREIMRRALELGATGLIMAHNHPSGDPEPSRSDLRATRAIADAARLFDIHLHDHIIIGRSGSLSLRAAGYL